MIEWKNNNKKYVNGEIGKLNIIKIFSLFFDGFSSSQEKSKYKLVTYLPGFKKEFWRFESIEEGKEKAEELLSDWLNAAGLQ